ncbi:MAG: class I SAM-dependent RNA methyltransferase, partial [Clostridia bacterium]|nr:class I SAM-dependent RNA methyltransferase [Clostridia bacterium]
MKIVVSTASGIEAVTKRELNSLGVLSAPAINGRIAFEGDNALLYKCNLFLSTASRVYIELGSFRCGSFDDLYDGLKEIAFEN